jgi:ParB family transcriptional regulator, chromosome partitioning protein
MAPDIPSRVELVPIDHITVINPRVRNKKIFKEIVENISEIGLKKPITVARRMTPEGPRYDLVCGQGRLDAFRDLGQRQIPALIVDAGNEDCLVMSLVENLARRQHRAIELLHDIEGLKRRGYTAEDVARKTGLTPEYVRAVTRLLEKGEHRLLRAVESGHIPLTVAIDIADTDDAGVQQALQHAYESKLLRGRKLIAAKRLIEQRRRRGKGTPHRWLTGRSWITFVSRITPHLPRRRRQEASPHTKVRPVTRSRGVCDAGLTNAFVGRKFRHSTARRRAGYTTEESRRAYGSTEVISPCRVGLPRDQ